MDREYNHRNNMTDEEKLVVRKIVEYHVNESDIDAIVDFIALDEITRNEQIKTRALEEVTNCTELLINLDSQKVNVQHLKKDFMEVVSS